ncbi:MAG: glutamate--tRNA ligase family protein, partial [Paracoccaceae bacterium]
MTAVVERFAPSPTGRLHLGHAYSALLAHDAARAAGGRFLLRLEDLDEGRVREPFARAIVDDLGWLGAHPDGAVLYQSTRTAAYDAALDRLEARGLAFRCACTRRDIAVAASAPQEGAMPPAGPDGIVYPGTCRRRPPPADPRTAQRHDMGRAIDAAGGAAGVAR